MSDLDRVFAALPDVFEQDVKLASIQQRRSPKCIPILRIQTIADTGEATSQELGHINGCQLCETVLEMAKRNGSPIDCQTALANAPLAVVATRMAAVASTVLAYITVHRARISSGRYSQHLLGALAFGTILALGLLNTGLITHLVRHPETIPVSRSTTTGPSAAQANTYANVPNTTRTNVSITMSAGSPSRNRKAPVARSHPRKFVPPSNDLVVERAIAPEPPQPVLAVVVPRYDLPAILRDERSDHLSPYVDSEHGRHGIRRVITAIGGALRKPIGKLLHIAKDPDSSALSYR